MPLALACVCFAMMPLCREKKVPTFYLSMAWVLVLVMAWGGFLMSGDNTCRFLAALFLFWVPLLFHFCSILGAVDEVKYFALSLHFLCIVDSIHGVVFKLPFYRWPWCPPRAMNWKKTTRTFCLFYPAFANSLNLDKALLFIPCMAISIKVFRF